MPVWVDQSPIAISESAQPVFQLVMEDVSNITSPSAKIYLNGTEKTSTCMSGSASASLNTITFPTIQTLKGGNNYVVAVTAIFDGVTDVRKLLLIVQKDSETQN